MVFREIKVQWLSISGPYRTAVTKDITISLQSSRLIYTSMFVKVVLQYLNFAENPDFCCIILIRLNFTWFLLNRIYFECWLNFILIIFRLINFQVCNQGEYPLSSDFLIMGRFWTSPANMVRKRMHFTCKYDRNLWKLSTHWVSHSKSRQDSLKFIRGMGLG